jgi:phosphoenolpyruvate carboxylase
MKKKDLYYERIPTKLLREDVKYLGDTLGKVIATQEGSKFLDLVENVRKLSKVNKKNPNQKKLN